MSVTIVEGLYPWQQNEWSHLSAYLKQDRIPQALLLTGAVGIGKDRLARHYARSLLCHSRTIEGEACGDCPGCRLFQANTHPDYVRVEPDEAGKVIGIDKIRQLIVTLSLKPQGPVYRVVIMSPAEQLNIASANAFLKCLEEPTERTSFVLITATPSRLPATIRSRCQVLNCRQPDTKAVATWLRQSGVGDSADRLLALCGHSPMRAETYADQGVADVYQSCFEEWLGVVNGKRNVVTVAESWFKLEQPPSAELLSWVLRWLVDLVKLKLDCAPELLETDYKKALQGVAERLELHGLYRYYDEVLKARQLLATQVNKQLLFEQLLIGWLQLHRS